MSLSSEPLMRDDEIDLRELVDKLLRHKMQVLVLVVVAVAVAGILSYGVIPPTYQASVAVALPPFDSDDSLGMTPESYEKFAVSVAVLDALKKDLSIQRSLPEIRDQFNVKLDKGTRLLTVTVSANSSEEAYQLSAGWLKSFGDQTQLYVKNQLAAEKGTVETDLATAKDALVASGKALAEFDRVNSISLLESRLSGIENELVESEARFRELTSSVIPSEQARLQSMESSLANEGKVLRASTEKVSIPDTSSNPRTVNDASIQNLTYLSLSGEVATSRARLAALQREAETLEEHIPSLQAEADKLRDRVVALKAERESLARELEGAQMLYDLAVSERNRLVAAESRLTVLTRLDVVDSPVYPEKPVSPRKLLNMVLAGFLAMFVGIALVLLREWWSETDQTMAAGHGQYSNAESST